MVGIIAAAAAATPPDLYINSSSSRSRGVVISSVSSCFNKNKKIRMMKGGAGGGGGGGGGARAVCLISEAEYFQVGKLIGSYGFINITSHSSSSSGSGMMMEQPQYYDQHPTNIGPFKLQDVAQGNVNIRLYEGRLAQGPLRGTPVIFKVYPGQRVGGIEADLMAANELNAHAFLQQTNQQGTTTCQNIQLLLGGFETTTTGEQWLAFRNHGIYTAAHYAKVASEKMSKVHHLGDQNFFWNPFHKDLTLQRRSYFITRLLRGTMIGLSYMHDRDRLHQSLGPHSVVLNTIVEKEADYLVPRLRDLAFSVDMRYPELQDDSRTLSQGLWRRAAVAGAFTPLEKRAFGIADDIYEAGLLFAYLAFVPFCEAGIMDSLSLRRLLENTFQLDLEATREYCLADDRLSEAVQFLDLNDGAGWDLLQAMLNRDFWKRPTAEAVLKHRFLGGTNV